jgi:hypothetical protein
MARVLVGDPIAVANPPPLPPAQITDGSSSGGATRGPKMGSKGHSRSRTRDSGTPTHNVGSRGEGESATPTELDSPIDPARRDSPVEHGGEAPHTPVHGAHAINSSVHASGGAAPKAARRLRDTTSATNPAGDECHFYANPSPGAHYAVAYCVELVRFPTLRRTEAHATVGEPDGQA